MIDKESTNKIISTNQSSTSSSIAPDKDVGKKTCDIDSSTKKRQQ